VKNIAPPVIAIGMLSAVSFGLYWAMEQFVTAARVWPPLEARLVDDPVTQQLCCHDSLPSFQRMINHYWPLMYPGSLAAPILFAVFGVLCLILANRVDINEFSMHHFYRNRLVRAYLGASRLRNHRWPNAFTGFDLEDDIRLDRFQSRDSTHQRDMVMDNKVSYGGPFPILNTALNITRGADLGIQERKAESFVFKPRWSGFDFSRLQTAVKRTHLS
jgi:hypothetical protein